MEFRRHPEVPTYDQLLLLFWDHFSGTALTLDGSLHYPGHKPFAEQDVNHHQWYDRHKYTGEDNLEVGGILPGERLNERQQGRIFVIKVHKGLQKVIPEKG